MDEIEEMIAILKAIQRHRNETSLLIQRAKLMCPTIMDRQNNWAHERVHTLLDHDLQVNQWAIDRDLKEQIQEYEGRKVAAKGQEQ